VNSPAYFELQAKNPSGAASFYRSVFGWDIDKDDRVPIEYWRVGTPDGISGAIFKRPVKGPPLESATNAAVLSMEVPDYDQAAERIRRCGGRDALAKFAVPGRCWQGYFIDPEGNTFGIFEVDVSAR